MDGGDRMPPRPALDINSLQIPVMLPVAAWQQTLDVLGKERWCDINSLMIAIHRQVQDMLQRQQMTGAEPPT